MCSIEVYGHWPGVRHLRFVRIDIDYNLTCELRVMYAWRMSLDVDMDNQCTCIAYLSFCTRWKRDCYMIVTWGGAI
jgi:hypothetical protein